MGERYVKEYPVCCPRTLQKGKHQVEGGLRALQVNPGQLHNLFHKQYQADLLFPDKILAGKRSCGQRSSCGKSPYLRRHPVLLQRRSSSGISAAPGFFSAQHLVCPAPSVRRRFTGHLRKPFPDFRRIYFEL